jgi:peptidyl-prolyl cis-trans isomerase D
MTMLDRMRRHKSWLKWSLGVVCATFVLLYVPQFLKPSSPAGAAAPGDVIASVDGRTITAAEYQQVYDQQIDQLRASYGDVSDQMIKQLGLGERLVQQLVDREAVVSEADRLGIKVTDGELRERLLRLPMLQRDGQFVGWEVYNQMLQSGRPPIRPADFEADLRKSLMTERLEAAVTGWIRVSDQEVEQEYRRRNEKIKLDLVAFTADKFRVGITPTDAEVSAEFAAHTDAYRQPEKRRVKYVAVDAQALRAKMTVTPQEIQDRYQQNIATYSTPEQIRASHILFKTEGKDEAAVRKLAESVLAKVKAGGDFAALAKQYSEDDGSKANGGDLDYFGHGSMVKEFEDAAWALQPGQVSDLVKTQFGFHIIKVTGKRPAVTRSLDQVKGQIEDTLRLEKARAEATRLATEMAKDIKTPADLDTVAKAHGLTVSDSGLFSRDEPLAGLGFAPAVTNEAFTLDKGKVSGMITTNQGYAFIAVTDVKPSYLPKLDEVKDKVRDAVIKAKAVDVARAKAAAMAKAATTNFAAAARAAGVEVKTTDLITRGAALPEVGVSQKVDDAAFALKTGETSAPIDTDNAVVVVHVRDRQDILPQGLDNDRENLRNELTQQRANEFFSAYMAKAKQKMKIQYNEQTLNRLIGA